MSEKPKPLKVFGRTHYACTRCKLSKIKCSGEKPACTNCKLVNKEDHCVYPTRDRKIVIMELDLNKLHARVKHLEDLLRSQGAYSAAESSPKLESMVQERVVSTHISESYLLPDAENEHIPYKLLVLCGHQLPEKNYAWQLLDKVCRTYSSEFYLIDYAELGPLVNSIYHFFENNDLRQPIRQQALATIPPISLCFFFVLLAFGEQMHNSTMALLPLSLAASPDSNKIPGIDFYTTASKLFNLSHEEIDIQFIQSALLLGLFACNLNRYNTVYNFFGVAVRSAVANGYHRQMDTPPQLDDDLRRQHRNFEEKTKRLWWSIFVIDVVWAARMNMPVHIDYTDTDVSLPNESPLLDLGDNFNTEFLEANVHLMKNVAKFNRLIYGPNIRTFSMNYINTEQINQKLLVKNILTSLNDIVTLFELTILEPYKKASILALSNRNLANLFLRYNQLIILVIEPLLTLVFNRTSAANIENNAAIAQAISTGIAAATRTVLIMLKLYEHDKLFVLGFWDSQHLFSALLIITMVTIAGYRYKDHNKAVALLKHMADSNNINARNNLQKLEKVREYLDSMPEVSLYLNLNSDITNYVLKKSPRQDNYVDEHYNPFIEQEQNMPDLTKSLLQNVNDISLYENCGFTRFSEQSQATLWNMAKSIQSWDNYRGLPIHVSGTGRAAAQQKVIHDGPTNLANCQIGNLI